MKIWMKKHFRSITVKSWLKNILLEMIDIMDGEGFESLNLGDDSEEAVVDVNSENRSYITKRLG